MTRTILRGERKSGNPLLMAVFAFAVGGFVPAVAATTYKVDGTKLQITVPAGETNAVDSTELSPVLNNEVSDIEKLGEGCIEMTEDISAYKGDIHVKKGTWRFFDSNGLGSLAENPNTSVYVEKGATLENHAQGTTKINLRGKTIVFEGTGVNGIGALLVRAAADQSSYTFGTNLVMTGDALINGLSDKHYYINGYGNYLWLNMNGHDLTVNNGQRNAQFYYVKTRNPGRIIAVGQTRVAFQDINYFWRNTDDNCFVMEDASKFSDGGGGMRGTYEWGIRWNSTGTNSFDKLVSGITADWHLWKGKIDLLRTMTTSVGNYSQLNFANTISGNGGLRFLGGVLGTTNFVKLTSGDNTFKGGVSGKQVAFQLVPGAVPADGGAFEAEDSSVTFADNSPDSPYALPTGVVSVSSARTVSGGVGSWKHLTKEGDGALTYDSSIGADELDVRGGSVALSAPSEKSWMAGVIEGSAYYTKATLSQPRARTGEAFHHRVVASPEHLYTNYGKDIRKWTVADKWWFPEDMTNACTAGKARYLITYSGYIWNRTGTAANWTFAGNLGNLTLMFVNGTKVFEMTNTKETRWGTVTLQPGPNYFVACNEGKINDGGTQNSATNMVPNWNGMGVRYDPTGSDSNDATKYLVLQNKAGEPPLLTWCKPGEAASYPRDDKVLDDEILIAGEEKGTFCDIPSFKGMSFASGTGIDFGGNAYSLDCLKGLPTVTDTAGLTVEDRWTVDVADVLAGGCVKDVPVALGDDVELVLTNLEAARRRKGVTTWTIVRSTAPIAGSISIKDPEVAERWSVSVSDKTISLTYRPSGLVLVVR